MNVNMIESGRCHCKNMQARSQKKRALIGQWELAFVNRDENREQVQPR